MIEFVNILGGSFIMGCTDENAFTAHPTEYPARRVSVNPFKISRFLITQQQYKRVIYENPSYFKRRNMSTDSLPVEMVSWLDAINFCNAMKLATGKNYSLPSEAQWEYACKANTQLNFMTGDVLKRKFATYDAKSPSRVGVYTSNKNGLYDMHGNVWEWCLDDWHDSYVDAPHGSRPWLEENSKYKVVRGGSWASTMEECRSTHRTYYMETTKSRTIGFRVVINES